MTAHRRQLPSDTDVRTAIEALTAETGQRPSVLALATRLGLANTTFRRNFPGICTELATAQDTPDATNSPNAYARCLADSARLRRDNRNLTEQLELAIAAIQRLSTDNDRLRTALHDAHSVAPLPRRPR